jgi:MOSC domain-containing protein YiiM
VAVLDSVNVGRPQANPHKKGRATGIGKRPVDYRVEVRAPGSRADGLGSGLVGDFIGDRKHHGGDSQAVYAYAREDLDAWQRDLGRELPNGSFGENLTTRGLNVTAALLGEQWRIGREVVLQVTAPRIPCATFRGFLGVPGWLKTFTAAGIPGTYLRVVQPGTIASGDPIEVVSRPDHHVSIALVFRALTTDRGLMPRLLEAGDDLEPGIRREAEALARAQTAS